MGTLVLRISVIACLTICIRSLPQDGVHISSAHNVCDTEECQELSTLIRSGINRKEKPCNDFYEYVCGKRKDIVVPHGVATWAQLEEGKTAMRVKVANYLREKPTDNDIYPIRWAKSHFQACMNQRVLNSLGVRPLLKLVNNIGGWSMLGENSRMAWLLVHNYYSQMMGTGALFTCQVGPDENFENNVLIISPAEELFLGPISKLNQEDISEYQNFLAEILKALRKEQGLTESSLDVTAAIENVLRFRQQIIKKRNHVRRDSKITTMTLSELQKRTQNKMRIKRLDWMHVVELTFKNLVDFKFNRSTVVHIRQPEYLDIILQAIDASPVEVLLHHIHFHFLERFIQETTVSMNTLYYKVLKQRVPQRLISCVSSNAMNTIVKYIYVKHFFNRGTNATVRDIARNVRDTLKDQISRTEWIERSIARKAKSKLDKIKFVIGYSEWYAAEKTNIMDYYVKMKISDDYFANVVAFETMFYRRALQRLWKPVTTEQLKQPPDSSTINAPYNYITNKIGIPAQLLQVPFFGMSFPDAVNYGGLATIIGHSLSRSFDSFGRRYDGNGLAIDWWTSGSLNEYKKRLRCYSDRFEKAFIKEHLRANLNYTMDETEYLDEIDTKYMGLVAGYQSYRKERRSKAEESKAIINLKKITSDKLFFVAYAAAQCEAIDIRKVDPMGIHSHLPYRLHLNIALSNMQPFADAFQCKENDPMNSSDKCEWLDESNIYRSRGRCAQMLRNYPNNCL